jgi:DNA excision repair protein ERCC-1
MSVNKNDFGIKNPYAKKPSSSAATTAPFGASSPQQPSGATSFSQCFDSIDDTPFFQQQTSHNSNSNKNTTNLQQQQQQRAFEQQSIDPSSVTASSSAVMDPLANNNNNTILSDRDHHILLQQPHVLYASHRQQGNAVLAHIKNVPVQFARMTPDFILAPTRCALFLSCKYHALYPTYLSGRIAELRSDFELRVLLVLVDTAPAANDATGTSAIQELSVLSVQHNLTLVLAWSNEEAARYLETFKAYHGKDASTIQKRTSTDYMDQVTDVFSGVVNKTDAKQLIAQFGSIRRVVAASPDELALVPGLGEVKVKRLYGAWHKPFSNVQKRNRRLKQNEKDNVNASVNVNAINQVDLEDATTNEADAAR